MKKIKEINDLILHKVYQTFWVDVLGVYCLFELSGLFFAFIISVNDIDTGSDSGVMDLCDKYGVYVLLFILMPLMAFIEEVLFRWLPSILFKNNVVTSLLLSCMLFGWAHGSLWTILVQGVGGLGLCVVYLKGLQTSRFKALWFSTLIHYLWNFLAAMSFLAAKN